ncbi:hypothetical protein AC579_1849 [Pseudocercospora musae]|uniref:Uncharacterized protein n=1 Tax=Pseudocercospora musae TaxID=113226 RepID=A0A139I6T6_9PEZI|nr:hypothetical protein AC579_1849 [Pseudocercospora musae]
MLAGFGAHVKHHNTYDCPNKKLAREKSLDKCVALIEQRKQDENWESSGGIESLILDPTALKNAVWPEVLLEDEREEINERDAYQVAYGRSFTREFCPCGIAVWGGLRKPA